MIYSVCFFFKFLEYRRYDITIVIKPNYDFELRSKGIKKNSFISHPAWILILGACNWLLRCRYSIALILAEIFFN
jgi:hypothetical protein